MVDPLGLSPLSPRRTGGEGPRQWGVAPAGDRSTAAGPPAPLDKRKLAASEPVPGAFELGLWRLREFSYPFAPLGAARNDLANDPAAATAAVELPEAGHTSAYGCPMLACFR